VIDSELSALQQAIAHLERENVRLQCELNQLRKRSAHGIVGWCVAETNRFRCLRCGTVCPTSSVMGAQKFLCRLKRFQRAHFSCPKGNREPRETMDGS
jgi:hypothetical protein